MFFRGVNLDGFQQGLALLFVPEVTSQLFFQLLDQFYQDLLLPE